MPFSLNNPSILLKDAYSPYFSHQKLSLPLCELYVTGIQQHVFYCVQFVFLNIITVRLIRVVGFNYTFTIFFTIRHSIVQIHHRLFSYFTVDGHLGYIHFRAFIYTAAQIIVPIFYAHVTTFLLDVYLGVKWPGHRELKFNLSR